MRAGSQTQGGSQRVALVVLAGAALVVASVRPARAEGGEVLPTFEKLDRRADARATYDANSFEIIHVESTSVGVLWNSTTTWWRVSRGVYRMPTTYGDFYRALGRADLAAAEETRHAWAETLYWGGLVAMLGGFVAGGYELVHHRDAGALVGAGVVVGGFVSLRIGGALSRPALDEADAHDLANRYDDALARHLGVAAGASF
jgi:hypothetical protein